MKNLFLCLILITSITQFLQSSEITFIAINLATKQSVLAIGSDLDYRVTPCCTFNIPLSLIGYEICILRDEDFPIWPYDGSNVPVEAHKAPQSPRTWMSLSVVWYSKCLIGQIGLCKLQQYVSLFSYGNKDVSGDGFAPDSFVSAHICASLKISPREQVRFIEDLLSGAIPVSKQAIGSTRNILLNKIFSSGWSLFGKTGTGMYDDSNTVVAWYVGWIEKGQDMYPFALLLRNPKTIPTKEERQRMVENYFKNYGIAM